MSPKSVGAVPLGAEAGDPRLPKAGTTRFPTPIPTLNVSTSARPEDRATDHQAASTTGRR